jgi:hypothetical protein
MSTRPGKAKTTEPATRHSLRRTGSARHPTILVVEDHDARNASHAIRDVGLSSSGSP